MRKYINKFRSVTIQPPACALGMRVYRNGIWYLALVDFVPSSYPSFIDAMERITTMERVTNYPETGMGVLQFRAAKGLPVSAIHDLLIRTAATEPISVTHYNDHHE